MDIEHVLHFSPKVTTRSIKTIKQNYWNWLKKFSRQGKACLSNERLKFQWNLKGSSIGDIRRHTTNDWNVFPKEVKDHVFWSVGLMSVPMYYDKTYISGTVLWAYLDLSHISLQTNMRQISSSPSTSSTWFLVKDLKFREINSIFQACEANQW